LLHLIGEGEETEGGGDCGQKSIERGKAGAGRGIFLPAANCREELYRKKFGPGSKKRGEKGAKWNSIWIGLAKPDKAPDRPMED